MTETEFLVNSKKWTNRSKMMTRNKIRWANKWNNRMQETKVTRKRNNSSNKIFNSNKKKAL